MHGRKFLLTESPRKIEVDLFSTNALRLSNISIASNAFSFVGIQSRRFSIFWVFIPWVLCPYIITRLDDTSITFNLMFRALCVYCDKPTNR